MILNELFDKHLPYKVTKNNEFVYKAIFNDPDENKYVFVSEKNTDSMYNTWNIEFAAIKDDGLRTSIIIGGRRSLPIFSTIAHLAKQVVTSKSPEVIVFESEINEPSRISLYRTLAKKMATYLSYNTIERNGDWGLTEFYVYDPSISDPTILEDDT